MRGAPRLTLLAVIFPMSTGCTLPDILYQALGDHYTATDTWRRDHYDREIERARSYSSVDDRPPQHYAPWHDGI